MTISYRVACAQQGVRSVATAAAGDSVAAPDKRRTAASRHGAAGAGPGPHRTGDRALLPALPPTALLCGSTLRGKVFAGIRDFLTFICKGAPELVDDVICAFCSAVSHIELSHP